MQLILWIFGVLFSLPCIYAYFHVFWIAYLQWLGHIELWHPSTKLYIFAAAMHMACVIAPYKSGNLIVCGIPTGIWLRNGLWFIPNVLHMTITLFNWAICRVLPMDDHDDPGNEPRINIRLDSSDSIHLMHTNPPMLVVGIMRLTGGIARFMFGYKKGQGHETISRLGFRVMIAAAIWAWWANDRSRDVEPVKDPMLGAVQAAHAPTPARASPLEQKRDPLPEAPTSNRHAVINLSVGRAPIDLSQEMFIPNSVQGSRYCGRHGQDSRLYCQYNEFGLNYTDTFPAKEGRCLMIPKGKQAQFFGARPTNAINMEDDVEFVPGWWAPWSDGKTTWKNLRSTWWQVDSSRLITVYAIGAWKFPDEEYGALMCF
jgi:hypothetical protein